MKKLIIPIFICCTIIFGCHTPFNKWKDCTCYDDLLYNFRNEIKEEPSWEIQNYQNGIILKSKKIGQFCSDLSPSLNTLDSANCIELEVKLYLVLVPELKDKRHKRLLSQNMKFLQKTNDELKWNLRKTYILDTQKKEYQKRILKSYKILPTHKLGKCHDLLLFTNRPYYFSNLKPDLKTTEEYLKILRKIDNQFDPYFEMNKFPYLGFLRTQIISSLMPPTQTLD